MHKLSAYIVLIEKEASPYSPGRIRREFLF